MTGNKHMKTIIHIEPPANMVAWYPGDGNADDIQGGNNGTLHGTASYGQAEVLDGFSFDGNAGQSVVENVGVTFTPRSVVDDRWQKGFSSLVHTSFAISAAFFFWKE
jgi:hypothetical protein